MIHIPVLKRMSSIVYRIFCCTNILTQIIEVSELFVVREILKPGSRIGQHDRDIESCYRSPTVGANVQGVQTLFRNDRNYPNKK